MNANANVIKLLQSSDNSFNMRRNGGSKKKRSKDPHRKLFYRKQFTIILGSSFYPLWRHLLLKYLLSMCTLWWLLKSCFFSIKIKSRQEAMVSTLQRLAFIDNFLCVRVINQICVFSLKISTFYSVASVVNQPDHILIGQSYRLPNNVKYTIYVFTRLANVCL